MAFNIELPESRIKNVICSANISAMYKALEPYLIDAFTDKTGKLSDYDMFMKHNIDRNQVYLPKNMVNGGACVVAPYQITQGSLPAIVVSGTGQHGHTDIYLGGLTISGSTTVGQFAQAVVDNNNERQQDYRYGDQISYFLVKQMVNADTQIPYCQVFTHKVVLDKNNTDKLWNLVDRRGFGCADSVLTHTGTEDGNCAYTWVHSRLVNERIVVSTQKLFCANDTMLAQYQGTEAYNTALNSYGYSFNYDPNVPFMSPRPLNQPAAPRVEMNSMEYIVISAENGCDIYYTTGDSTPTTSSTLYSGPFEYQNNTTIKAIAVKNGIYSAITYYSGSGSNDSL